VSLRCRTWLLIIAGMALIAGANGCKDKSNPLTGDSPSTVVFPASGVSYGIHVQPLFNQACNNVDCHDDGQHQSVLKLTTYDNAVRMVIGIVVPGNPDGSVLVLRIQGSVGTRMPPSGPALNQNQINGIRTWVAEGAKNN
jgi:hypothetical protein